MELSNRDAFYETMYFHEIAERDRLDDRFRTLLVIVGVVFSIIAYLFNATVINTDSAPLLFWLVYGLALISFVASVSCYIKAWHSQHYQAFPVMSELERYIAQISDHYLAQTDERTARQWTEQAFTDYMRQSFIEHASFNAHANDNKRFWLYYGNSLIISAFVFSIMAFFPVSHSLF